MDADKGELDSTIIGPKSSDSPQLRRRIESYHLMIWQKIPEQKRKLLETIRENIIGINASFIGPFGPRKVVYCDFVASGKPVRFIEDYICDHVYPFYANTHTTTSVSGLQTTTFREEARDIIKKCCNATEEDAVIFTGSGATSAVNKLVHVMQLNKEKAGNTVVIISPYEHHSNILPWREIGVTVVRADETKRGTIDIDSLEDILKKYKETGKDIILSMSAASNVTGIRSDTVAISELVHKYGGLAFWDYACAGPYVDMDMNPSETGYKDAVFVSPHKFVGGVGTPGLLIAKKKLFTSSVPAMPGGGTVQYVVRDRHRYVTDIEAREEGGTPAIVESIRCGMAFNLKHALATDTIEILEEYFCEKAFSRWKKHSNLHILGSHSARRLPIFSVLISHPPSGKYLHHNFVSVLLNDLYGIQARGGCACAGPYVMDLLCMSDDSGSKITSFLEEQDEQKPLEIMKPGFARLNFPYFLDGHSADYIIQAVSRIAEDGWKLLPLYTFDPYKGTWNVRNQAKTKIFSLHDLSYERGVFEIKSNADIKADDKLSLDRCSHEAESMFDMALEMTKELDIDDEEVPLEDHQQGMVWFLQPKYALYHLRLPILQTLSVGQKELPFKVRNNSKVYAKHKFFSAMENLGYKMENLKEESNFYGGDRSMKED